MKPATTAVLFLISALRVCADSPRACPTSAEILEAAKSYLGHLDPEFSRPHFFRTGEAQKHWIQPSKADFNAFVANLHSGEGSNYIPAIALSGWHDRRFLGEFERALEKFSRIEAYAKANAALASNNHGNGILRSVEPLAENFFLEELPVQIALAKRDIAKNKRWILRISNGDGWRGIVRDSPTSLTCESYAELCWFLRFAPSVFITNLEASAAASLDTANAPRPPRIPHIEPPSLSTPHPRQRR